MPYDEQSFLSGLAAGRNMESWPALRAARAGILDITVDVDVDVRNYVRVGVADSYSLPKVLPKFPAWWEVYGSGTRIEFVAYWGDGTKSEYNTDRVDGLRHNYSESGRYRIIVVGLPPDAGSIILDSSNNSLYYTGNQLVSVNAPLPSPASKNIFEENINLEYIDDDVFKWYKSHRNEYALNVDSLNGCLNIFKNCKKLRSIPHSLFDNITFEINRLSTLHKYSMSSWFRGCEMLSDIPDGLFDNREFQKMETCAAIFMGCKSISGIPGDLFYRLTDVTTFESAFSGCEGIESIPGNLFRKCQSVESFAGCFASCKNITEIPSDLFVHNGAAEDFQGCFSGCTSLELIPDDLFDSCHFANNFKSCFYGCTNITGAVPELWNKFPEADGTGCFAFCRNASNYDDIPYEWK